MLFHPTKRICELSRVARCGIHAFLIYSKNSLRRFHLRLSSSFDFLFYRADHVNRMPHSVADDTRQAANKINQEQTRKRARGSRNLRHVVTAAGWNKLSGISATLRAASVSLCAAPRRDRGTHVRLCAFASALCAGIKLLVRC